jgi:hypothetical protein
LRFLEFALKALVLQDVDQFDWISNALLFKCEVDEGFKGDLEMVGLTSKGDKLCILVV